MHCVWDQCNVSPEDMKLCNIFKFHIEGKGQFTQLAISSRLNSSSEFLNFLILIKHGYG